MARTQTRRNSDAFEKRRKRHLVVIEVDRGVIQEVYCSSGQIQVVRVDADVENVAAIDREISVREKSETERCCDLEIYPTVPVARLPHGIRETVERAFRRM